jgi:hypothetical protein
LNEARPARAAAHDAVHHGQAALDLAAEVRVAGRVDDVDRQPAVLDRGVLGEDRDPLFALQVIGVHDSLVDVGVRAERARLPQHGVDQRGLAMVDVRDDSDITHVVAGRQANRGLIDGGRRGGLLLCGHR